MYEADKEMHSIIRFQGIASYLFGTQLLYALSSEEFQLSATAFLQTFQKNLSIQKNIM